MHDITAAWLLWAGFWFSIGMSGWSILVTIISLIIQHLAGRDNQQRKF